MDELVSDVEALRKRVAELESERDELRAALNAALGRALCGELPVCTRCKRIRDQEGSWIPLEFYIQGNSEATIQEDLCPYCRNEYLYGFARR